MPLNSSLLASSGILTALGAAFVLGLTGSLHCVLMCGPLACAASAGARDRWTTAWAYQASRVASYAVVGFLLGGMGAGMGQLLSVSVRTYLPWVMALSFVAAALEWGRFLPALPGVGRLALALARRTQHFSPPMKAASIGLSTAFLPCGLLYGVLAVSATSGSMVEGGLIATSFAVGGLPALMALQWQTGWFQRLGTGGRFFMRRVLPLTAAVALVVRAMLGAEPSGGPSTPSCH